MQPLQREQINANIRNNIRLLVDKRKISYKNLADAIRVDESLIQNILDGLYNNPDAYLVYKIAHYFNYDVDTFILFTPNQLEKIKPTLAQSQAVLSAEQFESNYKEKVASLAKQKNIDVKNLAQEMELGTTSNNHLISSNIYDYHRVASHLNSVIADNLSTKQKENSSFNSTNIPDEDIKKLQETLEESFDMLPSKVPVSINIAKIGVDALKRTAAEKSDDLTQNLVCASVGEGAEVLTAIGITGAIILTAPEAPPLALAISAFGTKKGAQIVGDLVEGACHDIYPTVSNVVNDSLDALKNIINSPNEQSETSQRVSHSNNAKESPKQSAGPRGLEALDMISIGEYTFPKNINFLDKYQMDLLTTVDYEFLPEEEFFEALTETSNASIDSEDTIPIKEGKQEITDDSVNEEVTAVSEAISEQDIIALQKLYEDIASLENNDNKLNELEQQFDIEKNNFLQAIADHNQRMEACNAAIKTAIVQFEATFEANFKARAPKIIKDALYDARKARHKMRRVDAALEQSAQQMFDQFNKVTIPTIAAQYGFKSDYVPPSPDSAKQLLEKVNMLKENHNSLCTKIQEQYLQLQQKQQYETDTNNIPQMSADSNTILQSEQNNNLDQSANTLRPQQASTSVAQSTVKQIQADEYAKGKAIGIAYNQARIQQTNQLVAESRTRSAERERRSSEVQRAIMEQAANPKPSPCEEYKEYLALQKEKLARDLETNRSNFESLIALEKRSPGSVGFFPSTNSSISAKNKISTTASSSSGVGVSQKGSMSAWSQSSGGYKTPSSYYTPIKTTSLSPLPKTTSSSPRPTIQSTSYNVEFRSSTAYECIRITNKLKGITFFDNKWHTITATGPGLYCRPQGSTSTQFINSELLFKKK